MLSPEPRPAQPGTPPPLPPPPPMHPFRRSMRPHTCMVARIGVILGSQAVEMLNGRGLSSVRVLAVALTAAMRVAYRR